MFHPLESMPSLYRGVQTATATVTDCDAFCGTVAGGRAASHHLRGATRWQDPFARARSRVHRDVCLSPRRAQGAVRFESTLSAKFALEHETAMSTARDEHEGGERERGEDAYDEVEIHGLFTPLVFVSHHLEVTIPVVR